MAVTAAGTERTDRRAAARPAPAEFFLPDFCEARVVLAVVLIAELLAVMLALAHSTDSLFLTELARTSVFVQWAGLTSAALICYLRPRLESRTTAVVSLSVFAIVLGNVIALSGLATATGAWLEERGIGAGLFPTDFGPFVLRNVGIAAIAGALLLRYFFVSDQWRRHVRAEAAARIDALHARIRPHFLFNSLNTIAALTRSDPLRAEEAVEDLADLFRATLRDSGAMIRFDEELELARVYQRIEEARLGQRLRVQWDVGAIPSSAEVPGLTLQPLLENAINHGIEPIAGGGTITITGRCDGRRIHLTVRNPLATRGAAGSARVGNRVALANIRDRLSLAYEGRASLEITEGPDEYRADLELPFGG